MNMRSRFFSVMLSFALAVGHAGLLGAASFKQAEFTRVVNDVRMLPNQAQPLAAKVGDRVTGQTAVSTGVSSRAELQFPDKTLTRIGANSVFRLDKADRTVDLEQGVILLQVPKQIGGAKVRTAAVTAAVTGTTVMCERTPDGYIKIIVIEGQVDVYLNADHSVMRTLEAGAMLIFKEDAKQLPQPVQVDLDLLAKTSKLMDPREFGPLGNQKHLRDAFADQDHLKKNGELLKSAFEIAGRGTQVTLTGEARQEIYNALVLHNRPNGQGGGNTGNNAGGSNNGPRGGTVTSVSAPPRPKPGQPIFNSGTTIFGTGSSIVTNPHATAFNSLAGGVVTMEGTIYDPRTDRPFNRYMYGDAQTFAPVDSFLRNHGKWFVFKGEDIYLAGDIGVNSVPGPRNLIIGATNNVTLSQVLAQAYGSGGSTSLEGGPVVGGGIATDSVWTLPASVDALMISSRDGSIYMDSSFALVGSGGPQDVAFYAYGLNSDINIFSGYYGDTYRASIDFPEGTFKAYAGRDIHTDGALVQAGTVKLEAQRDVNIDNYSSIRAKTLIQINAFGSIHVQNSSQLSKLVYTDTLAIMMKAINGNVELLDSNIDASSVEMISERGGITLSGSTVLADVIKARVSGPGGELLISNSILGRDTPSANSLIKLYGEGAAGVRFSGDNTLNAASVDIAGNSVTIDPSGKVRLSHPANTRVFSDAYNFNNGTHGDFTDKGGAPVNVTKGSYGSRPPY